VSASLALAIALTGCAQPTPQPTPLPDNAFDIITGDVTPGTGHCMLFGTVFVSFDAEYGTVENVEDQAPERRLLRIPIAWPSGYTGRRFGDEVRVYDANGQLAAVTGKWNSISLAVASGWAGDPLPDGGVTFACSAKLSQSQPDPPGWLESPPTTPSAG
jgi:hypothetical protein